MCVCVRVKGERPRKRCCLLVLQKRCTRVMQPLPNILQQNWVTDWEDCFVAQAHATGCCQLLG